MKNVVATVVVLAALIGSNIVEGAQKQTKLDNEIKDMAHLEWILVQVQTFAKVGEDGKSKLPDASKPFLDIATRGYNNLTQALSDIRTAQRLGISSSKARKEFEYQLPLVKNAVSNLLESMGFKP